MIKKIILSVIALLLLLVAVLLFNTFRFRSKQNRTVQYQPAPAVSDSAIAHFQRLIQFRTISWADSIPPDSTQFLGLHRYLQATYPLVHQHLQWEIVSQFSLVYHWKGTDPAQRPLLLLAHMDVVPIEEISAKQWKVDPFSGIVKDGFIWGRGAYDNKVNLVSIMETAEKLLKANFTPTRSMYIVFTHDEELSGKNGTTKIAKLFTERNIRPELAIDEGGIITKEKVPDMKQPVALAGMAEKGYLTIHLEVQTEGGHSSMPANETAIDILSKALVKLRQQPFEPRLAPSQEDFIRYLGPEMPFVKKLVFANTWLTKGLIIGQYTKTNVGNAMMRTTMVPTIMHSGVKENVVPTTAGATINIRLLTGDSSKHIIARIKEIVNDPRIHYKITSVTEPSTASSPETIGYLQVEAAIRKTVPGVVIVPFLLIGGTDSHYFQHLCNTIVRFSPSVDATGNHGINERMSIDSYKNVLWFYEQLITGFTK